MNEAATKGPITVLIAALGGEGGAVLMNWIVNAAVGAGYPVQATSVPGVAQRTGATTYYIELWPHRGDEEAPVMALSPAPGEVDIMVASELAEAARAMTGGFVTPDRTTLIASTHRHYTNREKMAMGDGRRDSARIREALAHAATASVLFDAAALAKANATYLNAIMLGAVAAAGVLGLDKQALRHAIEAEGKAVEANLRGFELGFAVGAGTTDSADEAPAGPGTAAPEMVAPGTVGDYPEPARATIQEGVRRLSVYQNTAYAELFLDRLLAFRDADPDLVQTVARHLTVRMAYDDIIRVAQLKIQAGRLERIRGEAGAAPGEPVKVTDFFKPGIPELADLLPGALARGLLRWAAKKDRMSRLAWPLHVQTTTISGFLKIWVLAKLRWWRPRSSRWRTEQREIEDWLSLVGQGAGFSAELGREIAELSGLVKGYGSTHDRGVDAYRRIVSARVEPLLAGGSGSVPSDAASSIREARHAALADPDGAALTGAIDRPPADRRNRAAE